MAWRRSGVAVGNLFGSGSMPGVSEGGWEELIAEQGNR